MLNYTAYFCSQNIFITITFLIIYSVSEVSATVAIKDQKITETLTLRNCSSITDNTNASYTQ